VLDGLSTVAADALLSVFAGASIGLVDGAATEGDCTGDDGTTVEDGSALMGFSV